jgi:hypothetical protein
VGYAAKDGTWPVRERPLKAPPPRAVRFIVAADVGEVPQARLEQMLGREAPGFLVVRPDRRERVGGEARRDLPTE